MENQLNKAERKSGKQLPFVLCHDAQKLFFKENMRTKDDNWGQVLWWYTPAIPAMWEVEVEGS
jgi:hypothetical protein